MRMYEKIIALMHEVEKGNDIASFILFSEEGHKRARLEVNANEMTFSEHLPHCYLGIEYEVVERLKDDVAVFGKRAWDAYQKDMPFQRGEWAVLRHNSGGRLFHVGACVDASDAHRVSEMPSARFQPRHIVSASQLVRVSSMEEAASLVAVLTYIYGRHRHTIMQAEVDMVREMNRVCDDFRREKAS